TVSRRSRTTVLRPALPRYAAVTSPLCPPPMTMASYEFVLVASVPATLGRLPAARTQHFERGDPPVGAHDPAARVGRRAAQPEVTDRRLEPRVAGHRTVEEELLERQLALEDVALGQPGRPFDIERGLNVAVKDDVADVRGELGDPVDDGVTERLALVIPRPELGRQLVRRVLDEAADDVLAGRRHRRVDQGRDDHVDVGLAAEVPVLRVVVGGLHVVDRRAEADRAAEMLARAGQTAEVRQAVDGEVHLARRAA